MASKMNTKAIPSLFTTRNPIRWQFDSANRRLKAFEPFPGPRLAVDLLRREHPKMEKVILYARPGQETSWKSMGYRREGIIQGYFSDRQDCWLWCAYPEPSRGRPRDAEALRRVLEIAQAPHAVGQRTLPQGYTTASVGAAEVAEVTRLLKTVFPVYPSDLSSETTSRLVADGSSCFRMVRNAEGECVAVASAELNRSQLNAEMTDCATRPDQRGRGLMAYLIRELEMEVARRFRILDLYSLARGPEAGINRVFSRLGYAHAGALINNCRMPTGWETMNLWCKSFVSA